MRHKTMDNWYTRICLRNMVGLCSGFDYLLLTMLLYIQGLIVYSIVQKNNRRRLTRVDYIFFAIIIVLAIVGLVRLCSGAINVF